MEILVQIQTETQFGNWIYPRMQGYHPRARLLASRGAISPNSPTWG